MASSDLVNMGISVVSYTLKDIHDDQVDLHRCSRCPCAFLTPSPGLQFPRLSPRTTCTPWGRLGPLKSRKMLGLEKRRPSEMLGSG